jgi:hypothetical protein
MRASLRLWKPVRYSSRAVGSKEISSVAVILRLFDGGAIVERQVNDQKGSSIGLGPVVCFEVG